MGEQVMLSTAHHCTQYKSNDGHCVAKFMSHYDEPYKITATDEKHLTVTLFLPHNPQAFPVFHTSEIQPFHENDNDLFPGCALNPPVPVTINGEQEFFIEKIIDRCRRHNKTQYKVHWQGEGPEGNIWLPASELEDCEALDTWKAQRPKLPRVCKSFVLTFLHML
jgi:hypothetical protein